MEVDARKDVIQEKLESLTDALARSPEMVDVLLSALKMLKPETAE